MNRDDIEGLLGRSLKSETSAAENELIETWLEENGTANTEWQTFDQLNKEQWLSGLFNDIKGSIHANETKVITLPKRHKTPWRSIAAAAAIIVISFTLYLEWPALQGKIHPTQFTSHSVPASQKKQVALPDGSIVWVNAQSELRYPKSFNGKIREVYLSGEAYFDIKHNAVKPFIIHTGNLITTVLGTAFNIKEDKSKHTVEVTVTRGKVSVANGDKLLGVLTPNQQISFNTLKNKVVKQVIDANLVVAWQQRELRFDDVSFDEAISQLQRHFNVKISFANAKLKTCRFTGTALNGDKLDQILKVLCTFNNATYQTKADGSIVIDGPGCN